VKAAARITEFWYLLKARLALLAGRRKRARASLKGAVRRNPASFVAHFLLGRLYWVDRSVVKAKREFDLAWQIDPERFERSYARLRAQYEGIPELFPESALEETEEITISRRRRIRRFGDFTSREEKRRFEVLPPITRDEILEIDWDRFEEEIYRDQESL
jgi:hypothetical protein